MTEPRTNPMVGQLARPHGLFGRQVAREMNRRNWPMTERAIDLLELESGDTVLEVGFGGGRSLDSLLAAVVAGGKVIAIDVSELMVKRARRAHRGAMARGQLHIELADVATIPIDSSTIDKAVTSNAIYYWRDLDRGLAELGRVIRAGGLLAVAYGPPDAMAAFGMRGAGVRLVAADELVALLDRAGFEEVRRDAGVDRTMAWECVLARNTKT